MTYNKNKSNKNNIIKRKIIISSITSFFAICIILFCLFNIESKKTENSIITIEFIERKNKEISLKNWNTFNMKIKHINDRNALKKFEMLLEDASINDSNTVSSISSNNLIELKVTNGNNQINYFEYLGHGNLKSLESGILYKITHYKEFESLFDSKLRIWYIALFLLLVISINLTLLFRKKESLQKSSNWKHGLIQLLGTIAIISIIDIWFKTSNNPNIIIFLATLFFYSTIQILFVRYLKENSSSIKLTTFNSICFIIIMYIIYIYS